MHSSRMRTARAFTICRNLLLGGCTCLVQMGVYLPGPGGGVPAWSWGVYLPGPGGGVPGPRGCTCLVPGGVPGPRGVYLPGPRGWCTWSRGCTWSWGVYLPGPREGVYLPGLGDTWSWGGVPAWSQGVYLVLGGVLVRYSPPCEQNDKLV